MTPGFTTGVVCYQLHASNTPNVKWRHHWVAAGGTGCYPVSLVLHGVLLAPSRFLKRLLTVHWSPSSLPIPRWTGLAQAVAEEGLSQVTGCFRSHSQTKVGRPAYRYMGECLPLGLFPDCSCEGLEPDYMAASRYTVRPRSVGLPQGCGQACFS